MIWYFGDTVNLEVKGKKLNGFCVGRYGRKMIIFNTKAHKSHTDVLDHHEDDLYYYSCRNVLTEITSEIYYWEKEALYAGRIIINPLDLSNMKKA